MSCAARTSTVACLAGLFVLALPYPARTTESCYPGDVAVLEMARDRNIDRLAELRRACLDTATRQQAYVIYLASRLAEPEEFLDEFIGSVQVERSSKAFADYDRVERILSALDADAEFYPALQLAAAARRGNPVAIRKVVTIGTWIGGGVSEIYHAAVLDGLIDRTELTLRALAGQQAAPRARMLGLVFGLQLTDREPALRAALASAPSSLRSIAQEVEAALDAELKNRQSQGR